MTAEPAAAHRRQLLLLKLFLREAEGFMLGVAVADNDDTARLVLDEVGAVLVANYTVVIPVDLSTEPDDVVLLTLLQDRLTASAAANRRTVLWLTGLDAHLDYGSGGTRSGSSNLLLDANAHRDLFRATCPAPVVLWVSRLALPALAPDLWDWRIETYDFTNPEQTWHQAVERQVPATEHRWQTLDADVAARQQALLERLLAEPDDDHAAADPQLHARRRAGLGRSRRHPSGARPA